MNMDFEETKRNKTTESNTTPTTTEIYVVGILLQLAALAVWGLFWGHSLDGENSWSSWMSGLVAIYRRFLYLPPLMRLWYAGNFFFFPYVWSYLGRGAWGWAGDVNEDDGHTVVYYPNGGVGRGTGAGCLAMVIAGIINFVLWFAAVILGPIIARIYKWRERQALYHDSDPARYAEAVRAEKRLKRLLWVFVLLEIVVMGWHIYTH